MVADLYDQHLCGLQNPHLNPVNPYVYDQLLRIRYRHDPHVPAITRVDEHQWTVERHAMEWISFAHYKSPELPMLSGWSLDAILSSSLPSLLLPKEVPEERWRLRFRCQHWLARTILEHGSNI